MKIRTTKTVDLRVTFPVGLGALLLVLLGLVTLAAAAQGSESRKNVKEDVDWMSVSSVLKAVGRSITTSSVLTINLTNAVILAHLKAIVIIAGIFGKFSFWTFPGLGGVPYTPFARSFQAQDAKPASEIETSLLSQEDIRWASTYMWSLNKRDFTCLYRLACENPESARIYVHAGQLLDSAFQKLDWLVAYNARYKRILDSVQSASEQSARPDGNCKLRYSCEAPFVRGNKHRLKPSK